MTVSTSTDRELVDIRETSRISQGSLFNFAYSEEYEDHEILGLIITARCDISNDKVKKYSYLPVIPFCVWRENELMPILKRRKLKSIANGIQDQLSNAGYSRNTLAIYGVERLLKVLSREGIKPKLLDSITKAIRLHQLLDSSASYLEMFKSFEVDIKTIVKEIVDNRSLEYHFLDHVPGYGPCVVNLREVNHLDRFAVEQITKGIEFNALSDQQKIVLRSVNTKFTDGISSSIGIVQSPYIELVMQRFADLFLRIGVLDPKEDLHVRVCEEGVIK